MVTLVIVSDVVPVLVRVAFLTALFNPTATLPKAMLEGVSVAVCAFEAPASRHTSTVNKNVLPKN